MKSPTYLACSIAALVACAAPDAVAARPSIQLQALSSVEASTPGTSAAEIVAHDPATQRLFVVNGQAAKIDVVNISNPEQPALVGVIEIRSLHATFAGASPTSVAVKDGVLAVAVEASPKTSPGHVIFFDTDGNFLSSVTVGALPDMITFTPNGRYVLTANEGEPSSYPSTPATDPEGSVSVIDLSAGVPNLTQADVRTATFGGIAVPPGVRIFGPGASVAQDLEPEYITTSHDSKTAWVTLQENNALAILDISSATVTSVVALGTKEHIAVGAGIDASDRDSAINIQPWPVVGLYQPDGIASFKVGNQTYLVLANEGDGRAWSGISEEARVGEVGYVLDPKAFPNATSLKASSRLGRLRVSKASGDVDGDGDFDVIHSFGARSFSIRAADGTLVWDSGDQFEQITASLDRAGALNPTDDIPPFLFNANNGETAPPFPAFVRDDRSDNAGPEPEAIAVGKAFGQTYAFIALERVGGIMVYNVSNPQAPLFVDYVNNRDFTKAQGQRDAEGHLVSGDLGPEGLIFISGDDSPNGEPLVVVANEISGTTTIYQVEKTK